MKVNVEMDAIEFSDYIQTKENKNKAIEELEKSVSLYAELVKKLFPNKKVIKKYDQYGEEYLELVDEDEYEKYFDTIRERFRARWGSKTEIK